MPTASDIKERLKSRVLNRYNRVAKKFNILFQEDLKIDVFSSTAQTTLAEQASVSLVHAMTAALSPLGNPSLSLSPTTNSCSFVAGYFSRH